MSIKNWLLEKYHDFPKPLQKGKYLFCFSMVIVPLIGFIMFYCVVNINSVLLAFKEFNGYDENFNETYKWSLTQFEMFFDALKKPDNIIWLCLKNTFIFFLVSVLLIPVQFIVSYFLYKRVPGEKFFTIVFFVPHIISSVVMVSLFKSLISANGPVSYLCEQFGYELPKLLSSENTALRTIVFYEIWMGFAGRMILLRGGLNRIPMELIEAANLDGCNTAQEMWHIIVPCIWGTLSTFLILSFASIFSASGPILLFTKGQYGTSTLSYYIFSHVKFSASYEYPSAIGLVLTVIALPIAIFARKISTKIYSDVSY